MRPGRLFLLRFLNSRRINQLRGHGWTTVDARPVGRHVVTFLKHSKAPWPYA